MAAIRKPIETQEHLTIVEKPQSVVKSEAELRREMYERMAQGNALSEIEDRASQQWRR